MNRQLQLAFPRKGGRRAGAGRPRKHPRPGLPGPGVPHLKRPEFAARLPVHVTQRFQPGVGYLRRQSTAKVLQDALTRASAHLGMRIVHYSIQHNHLHLIVEAEGREALTRAMQGLGIRIARRLNARLRRSGPVFADRYHAQVMSSRREVANAVRYVLSNYRHHAREWLPPHWRDPLASRVDTPLAAPKRWLLSVGWKLEPPGKQSFFEPE
jgi:putative transposase